MKKKKQVMVHFAGILRGTFSSGIFAKYEYLRNMNGIDSTLPKRNITMKAMPFISYSLPLLMPTWNRIRNLAKNIYRVSQKNFKRLTGYGIKSRRLIFKTEVLIHQSKANLDAKNFLVKSHIFEAPKIIKLPLRVFYGDGEFHVPFWSMI